MLTELSSDRGGREQPGYPGFASRGWVSVHAPVAAGLYTADFDHFLRTEVFPYIAAARDRKLVTAAFFIRYGEGGPHVRLRLLPASAERRLELLDLVHSIDRVASWKEVPYEPELDRYGGRDAIVTAERFFDASTRLAMRELVPAVSSKRSQRLGKGLIAMIVTAYGLIDDEARVYQFLQNYGRQFLTRVSDVSERRDLEAAFDARGNAQAPSLAPYVLEVFQRLNGGESVSPAFDEYLTAVRGARRELARLVDGGPVRTTLKVFRDFDELLAALVPSYVHMTANRLGVTVPEEAFLASAAVLARRHGA